MDLVAAVSGYFASAALTVWTGQFFWDAPPVDRATLVVIAAGAGVPIGLAWAIRKGRGVGIVGAAAIGAAAVLALIALVQGWLPARPYGDGNTVEQLTAGMEPYPRWLIPISLAGWFYRGVWTFAPVQRSLGPAISDVHFYTAALGIVLMAGASVWLFRRYPRNSGVFLSAFTPVWLLFATGHVEVYPWVAGVFAAVLAWLVATPLAGRAGIPPAVLAGVLPLLYIGFAPVSLVLLMSALWARPREWPRFVGIAALSMIIGIAIFHPGGPRGFIPSLQSEMNLGNQHTRFPRYKGLAREHGFWFRSYYVWESEHLADLAYMYSWGGAALIPGLALLVLPRIGWRRIRSGLGEPRSYELAAVVGIYWYYFFFMIPKMGPRADVDLFFPTYIVTAFAAGILLDHADLSQRARAALLSVAVGSALAAGTYLCFGTIPQRL